MQRSLTLPRWLTELSQQLIQIPGVLGVVLGGSRARGNSKPDSDYDIGIYYRQADFDWDDLKRVAREFDKVCDPATFGAPGDWGPWINGGAWLSVEGNRVDLLLRDYDFVSEVAADCSIGKFSTHYQIGHPNAFYSYILISEVGLFVPLQDPRGLLKTLKTSTAHYPPALKKAIEEKFGFEAGFTLGLLKKLTQRDDAYYLAGLLFRFSSCLVQVLFAINEQYFMNEKGSTELTRSFSKVPKDFSERIKKVSSNIPDPENRHSWLLDLEQLFKDTMNLVEKS